MAFSSRLLSKRLRRADVIVSGRRSGGLAFPTAVNPGAAAGIHALACGVLSRFALAFLYLRDERAVALNAAHRHFHIRRVEIYQRAIAAEAIGNEAGRAGASETI